MFLSRYEILANQLCFPEYTGTRIMMMPLVLGESYQTLVPQYDSLLSEIFAHTDKELLGQVGYLTIDEQHLKEGETLRRPGLHVDGIYNGEAGGWGGGRGGGGGGPWAGNGMLLLSSTPHCRIYSGKFEGWPKDEGECDHLDLFGKSIHIIRPGTLYWMNPLCVHESIPVGDTTVRQFLRLSLPSTAPWFEGYTENPDGTQPTGKILPAREKEMSFKC